MAFGNKKKSSGSKPESKWRKIMSVAEGKEGGQYIKVDDYSGDLLFREKETGRIYKVNSVSLFEPQQGAPDFILMNGSINLANDKQVSDLGDGSEE